MENILVPFSRHCSDLNPLYHAFALAERIMAKVFVLFFKDGNPDQDQVTMLEKACMEMVHSACEEGMNVSFHIARDGFDVEFPNFIRIEHIDLIVIGDDEMDMESTIRSIKPALSVQIIKVKGKTTY